MQRMLCAWWSVRVLSGSAVEVLLHDGLQDEAYLAAAAEVCLLIPQHAVCVDAVACHVML